MNVQAHPYQNVTSLVLNTASKMRLRNRIVQICTMNTISFVMKQNEQFLLNRYQTKVVPELMTTVCVQCFLYENHNRLLHDTILYSGTSI